ncbi:hypothetical protein [Mycolicibacterium mageritense]
MRTAMGIAAATALLLTGCTETAAPAPTEPVDRQSVLRTLRGIDTCALFAGAETVAGHDVTIEGPASPLSCDARFGDADQKTDGSIALNSVSGRPTNEPSWVKHRTIDGIDVTTASSLDDPQIGSRDQVVSASCQFTARYPEQVTLMVMVSAPPDTDGCAIAEELTRTAMREYPKKPQWGSTDVARTVLTGADPCAVVRRLQPAHRIDVDVTNSSVNSCAFTLDGVPDLLVDFAYGDPTLLEYNADQFTVDGHRVSGDKASGTFDVVVGDQFTVGDRTLIPQVTIIDSSADMDRVRLIAQAVADEY